jgi:hypothetical protein
MTFCILCIRPFFGCDVNLRLQQQCVRTFCRYCMPFPGPLEIEFASRGSTEDMQKMQKPVGYRRTGDLLHLLQLLHTRYWVPRLKVIFRGSVGGYAIPAKGIGDKAATRSEATA